MRLIRLRQSFLLAFAFSFSTVLLSQPTAQVAATPVDESRLTTLRGTVHALARPEFDHGAMSDDFPVRRMLVLLKSPPEHQAALQGFLREVHTPGSPRFHQWMSPQGYGEQFGARDEDIQTVVAWLQAHGFSVARITSSKAMIEFSGTAGQVRESDWRGTRSDGCVRSL